MEQIVLNVLMKYYKCEHNFYEMINSNLNSNYYNCRVGKSDELRYGIIKYSKKENTLILIEIEL